MLGTSQKKPNVHAMNLEADPKYGFTLLINTLFFSRTDTDVQCTIEVHPIRENYYSFKNILCFFQSVH